METSYSGKHLLDLVFVIVVIVIALTVEALTVVVECLILQQQKGYW